MMNDKTQRLSYAGKMLQSLSYQSVLKRGYVVVSDENGNLLSSADQARKQQNVILEFKDSEKLTAIIHSNDEKPIVKKQKKPISAPKTSKTKDQGQLF